MYKFRTGGNGDSAISKSIYTLFCLHFNKKVYDITKQQTKQQTKQNNNITNKTTIQQYKKYEFR